MEAVMYFKEKSKMTRNCSIACEQCPLSSYNNKRNVSCSVFASNYPEEAVAIVEKWSKEHPRLTNKAKFIKDHPNAPLDSEGYPMFSPFFVGYCKEKNHCFHCEHFNQSYTVCWDEPYEGEEF